MSCCAVRYVCGLVLLALGCMCLPATAVTISPIMVELTPQKKVASIRVLNDSDELMTFQAETLSWQQTGGEDRYLQTQELLVAPPIAQIEPRASQIFRVTLRNSAPFGAERAYRLVFEDITTDISGQQGMVKLRFRHNLPLFVTPSQSAVANSLWRHCIAPLNMACIELENQGNRYVRLSGMAIEGPGWRKDIPGGSTVLAGATRQWMFDLKAGQVAASRVIVTSSVGNTEKAVLLPAPTP